MEQDADSLRDFNEEAPTSQKTMAPYATHLRNLPPSRTYNRPQNIRMHVPTILVERNEMRYDTIRGNRLHQRTRRDVKAMRCIIPILDTSLPTLMPR
mmetsp:Transcript_24631/g.68676  ORF Transcript_24631/g.68676 Transcript_24631/m.68676 type:complete len:97 (+) Transcript_24631:130-420(+)